MEELYLGQEVKTEHGEGKIVELTMPFNGMYVSEEQSKVVVWFGTENASPFVSLTYRPEQVTPKQQNK